MSRGQSVERVVNAIVDEVFHEASQEIKGAFDESLSQLERAREEVLQELRKRLSAGKRRADSLKVQRVSAAGMKAKWSKVQLLDEFVNKVLDESLAKIMELRSRARYRDILTNLALEGLTALNAKSAILEGSEEDTKFLREVAKDLSKRDYSLEVSEDRIQTSGGLRVLLQDGSITYDNTFEARLQRIKPELRRKLYALIED